MFCFDRIKGCKGTDGRIYLKAARVFVDAHMQWLHGNFLNNFRFFRKSWRDRILRVAGSEKW